MYQLPDAPLSLGGILDDGFKLFKASWKQLLPVAVIASLLSAATQVISAALEQVKPPDIDLSLVGLALLALLLIIVLSFVAYAVILVAVHQAAQSQDVSIGVAVREGLRRTPALLGVSMLYGLAVFGGLLLLLVPGFYVMVALYPALLLPVVERLGARASLSRARDLVKGSWWRTAGLLTVMGLILIALFVIISFIGEMGAIPLASTGAGLSTQVVIYVIVALVSAPLLPLSYCLLYAVYTDLRLRKDGGDLLARAAPAGA